MVQTDALDRQYVVFDELLPAKHGTAFEMAAGQVLRIVDLEGQQVPDFLCFNRSDYVDKFSPPNTQLLNGTIFLKTGPGCHDPREQ